jgi:hypothetical protein
LNGADLVLLRAGALVAFRELKIGAKLPGMSKPLTQDDVRLLAIFESALQVLNGKGAFKDGWLEANPIKLLEEDSLPREDDYL